MSIGDTFIYRINAELIVHDKIDQEVIFYSIKGRYIFTQKKIFGFNGKDPVLIFISV